MVKSKRMVNLIKDIATQFGFEYELIMAFIHVESGGNSYAMRYEPHYKWVVRPEKFCIDLNITYETEMLCQKSSWGLMQVMGAVPREYGFKGHITQLVEPQIGLMWGLTHLQRLKKRFPELNDHIAAYNAGSPRKDKTGKYYNQSYVDKVLAKYSSLKNKPS